MSGCLWPHGLQHTRLPCSSLSSGVCSDSCPLSLWSPPTSSFSVAPFPSCPHQPFTASGSFPVSWLFMSGAKVLELQHQHQSFQWIFSTDFLWGCYCMFTAMFHPSSNLLRNGQTVPNLYRWESWGFGILNNLYMW